MLCYFAGKHTVALMQCYIICKMEEMQFEIVYAFRKEVYLIKIALYHIKVWSH